MLTMLKFLPGILLLQAITVALVLIAPAALTDWRWLRVAIPVLIVGLLTAFWFGAVAAHQRKDEISRLQENYAKERETIRVNAERAKAKVVKQAHQEILQEVRRVYTGKNQGGAGVCGGGVGWLSVACPPGKGQAVTTTLSPYNVSDNQYLLSASLFEKRGLMRWEST